VDILIYAGNEKKKSARFALDIKSNKKRKLWLRRNKNHKKITKRLLPRT
jgi:hypothetical protein